MCAGEVELSAESEDKEEIRTPTPPADEVIFERPNEAPVYGLRRFKKIPVFVAEAHNDVLDYIYRCLGARFLPFWGCALVHFDAHPDMTVPRNVPAELIINREKLLNALSIENWIMPTVYAKHFDRLVWCKPPWSNQMPDGEFHFYIGEYADVMHVSSKLEYFVSEGSYQLKECLRKAQTVHLVNVQVPAPSLKSDEPVSEDEPETGIEMTRRLLDWENRADSFVLDIDLDFFTTCNPFRHVYSRVHTMSRLKHIFEYKPASKTANDFEVLAVARARRNQLDDLERIFKYLQETKGDLGGIRPACESTSRAWPRIAILCELLQLEYIDKGEEVDFMLVYNAGCTIDMDMGGLPHHECTYGEVDAMVTYFEEFLKDLLPAVPTIITMARSSWDGYCPPDQVDSIQWRVFSALQRVYGHLLTDRVIKEYEGEYWLF